MIINHTYKISYIPITYHIYEKYAPGISTVPYKARIEPYLHTIWQKLNDDPRSRQSVLTLNRLDFPSCLLSFQCQTYQEQLFVTINMRSQASELMSKDTHMYLYWITTVLKNLHYKIKNVDITCHVGNFHSVGSPN